MALGKIDPAFGEKLKSAFESRAAEPVPPRILALAEALDRALSGTPPRPRDPAVKDALSR